MKLLTTFSLVLALLFAGCESHEHESHDHDDGAAAEMEATMQATIDQYVGQWNTGDKDQLRASLADGFVREQNGETVATGFDEMSANADFFRIGFPDLKVVIDHSHFHDGQWFAQWTCSGTNTGEFNGQPATGKFMKVSGLTEASFDENGLLAKEVVFWDMLSFMTQIGYTLSPPSGDAEGA